VELASLRKGKPRILRLITGVPPEWNHADLLEALDRVKDVCAELKGRSLKELQLCCGDGRLFRDHAHYRAIRFDNYHLLYIDTGLEPLTGERVKRTCPTSLLPWKQDACTPFRNVEKTLFAECRFKETIPC
jgi:hypothetical protein